MEKNRRKKGREGVKGEGRGWEWRERRVGSKTT